MNPDLSDRECPLDGSDMESEEAQVENPVGEDVQAATQTLGLLQLYDRPVDFNALHQVLLLATRYYFRLISTSGTERDDRFESNFLGPLLKETLTQVCTRGFYTEVAQLTQEKYIPALHALAVLGFLSGQMLKYYWHATKSFQPTMPVFVRRDMSGILGMLAHLTTSASPFVQQIRFCGQLGLPVARFIAAAPSMWSLATNQTQKKTQQGTTEEHADKVAPGEDLADGDAGFTMEYFHIVNTINHFAHAGGMDVIEQALMHPDRCGLLGISMLLPVLQSASNFLIPGRRMQVLSALNAVLQYIEQGFAAAHDFSVFEGANDDSGPSYTVLSSVLCMCANIGRPLVPPDGVDSQVFPLQRELILRLLNSGNFTQQLAAVKELHQAFTRAEESDHRATLVASTSEGHSGAKTGQICTAAVKALVGWVRDGGIVRRVIRSNLHQTQYAEAAQRVLAPLLQSGGVSAEDLDLLWHLAEDATIFEDIRANACGMLGALAPYMDVSSRATLFSRVKSKGLSSSPAEIANAIRLLSSIPAAPRDDSFGRDVVLTLCDIVLRADASLQAATTSALTDACLRHQPTDPAKVAPEADWAIVVGAKCLTALAADHSNIPAAYQMDRIMTLVLSVYYPKAGQNENFHRVVNSHGAILVTAMKATSRLFSELANASTPGTLNLVKSLASSAFTHDNAVEILLRLVSEAVRKGTYYLTLVQLKTMYHWTTMDGILDSDADRVWDLLTSFVCGRDRQMQQDTAVGFFHNHLSKIDPERVTVPAWRCITAYMAVSSNWDVELREESEDYASVIEVSPGLTWECSRQLMAAVTLQGGEAVAAAASLLLAHLVGSSLGHVLGVEAQKKLVSEDIAAWRAELFSAVETLTGRLPRSWYDCPPLLSMGDIKNTAEKTVVNSSGLMYNMEACRRAQRALEHLHELVEQCHCRSVPSLVAHAASYRDVEMVVDLTMQSIAVETGTGHQGQSVVSGTSLRGKHRGNGTVRMSVALPCNSYVGALRAAAAEHARREFHVTVLPENIRMFSGGREHANDAALVRDTVRSPVMLMYSQQANQYTAPSIERRAELDACSAATMMVDDAALYGSVLAMAQLRVSGRQANQNSSKGSELDEAPIRTCSRLRQAAQHLLASLPTCRDALADVERLLTMDDARGPLDQLLHGSPSDTGVVDPNDALTRYVIEMVCSLVLPARTPVMPEDITSDAEMRAVTMQAQLFSSQLLPKLLEWCTERPTLGGPETAPGMHEALLLLASNVCGEILRAHELMKEGSSVTEQVETANVDPTDAAAARSILRYALAVMGAALQRFSSSPSNCIQGGNKDGSFEDVAIVGSRANEEAQERLCIRALELLRSCVEACPPLADEMVASSPEPDQYLSRVVNGILAHRSANLRGVAAVWVERLAEVGTSSRRWVLSNVVQPLLLATGTNEEQAELCNSMLSSLQPDEGEAASQLLETLIERLLVTADGDKPLRGPVESVLALVRALECQDMERCDSIVLKLLTVCLYPELSYMATTAGSDAAPAVLFENHNLVLKAAHRSPACREACVNLLMELVTHDRGNWDCFVARMKSFISAGLQALPHENNNQPMQSLRVPEVMPAGLKNGGATCYMSATFQQLFAQPTVRRLILSAPCTPVQEQEESVFHQVQIMFAHLAGGVEPWYQPSGFWHAFKDYEGEPVNIREHQDAYEFFTRFQDAVDEHLQRVGHPRAIHTALGGAFAQLITVVGRPELCSEREEEFYQISLDVRGKKGLLESLESYVAAELMDGQNQWFCEQLGCKVDAEKRTLIRRLPHTLMLHLKRFEWDYETLTRWKVKDRFEFPIALDMRPFTVEGVADAAAGSESTSDETLKNDARYYQYELRGVVVHSGTAFAGHYYSYVKSRTDGQWRCFDDTIVEHWDISDLEEDCFGGRYRPEGSAQEFDRSNSAYMLVYERLVDEEDTQAVVGQRHEDPSEKDSKCTNSKISMGPGAAEGLSTELQIVVATENIRTVAVSHFLSQELAGFFGEMAHEVRDALVGSRPRKAPRVALTSPSAGAASGAGAAGEGGASNAMQGAHFNGLARLASRRDPRDLDTVIIQAVELSLQYYCSAVARGPEFLVQEIGRRGRAALPAMIKSAIQSRSPVAQAVLAFAVDEKAMLVGVKPFPATLKSQHPDIRSTIHRFCCSALAAIREAEGLAAAVQAVKPLVDALLADLIGFEQHIRAPLQFAWLWEDAISTVAALATQSRGMYVLTLEHMDKILAIGRAVVDGFWKIPCEDHEDYDFGKSYLELLSATLCCYEHPGSDNWNPSLVDGDTPSPEGLLDQTSTPEGPRPNPYCIRLASRTNKEPPPRLPEIAWNFLFDDPSFLRRLLMPGCLSCPVKARLLEWLFWNNMQRSGAITALVLLHIEDDCIDTELAAELPSLGQALTVQDDLASSRIADVLLGPGLIELPGGDEPPLGLLEYARNVRGRCRRALIIRLLYHLWDHQTEAWAAAADVQFGDQGRTWFQWAATEISTLGDLVRNHAGSREIWEAIMATVPSSLNFYDLGMLEEALLEAAGPDGILPEEDDEDDHEEEGGDAALKDEHLLQGGNCSRDSATEDEANDEGENREPYAFGLLPGCRALPHIAAVGEEDDDVADINLEDDPEEAKAGSHEGGA